ncbi:MAG TPA: BatA domain-containing protein, partial [Planctomycetaceae bacterium]|nr:BatA domain-containing protein [Planctomycetaceae bacterium]
MFASFELLAFSFASPWLLWGLALGSAPIIIHLLNRRKFKETEWAAMRFLLAAVRKNARRLRIEQLILLAVRTLLLLLVVLALAQPTVEQLSAFFQPGQPVHKIIVIDASLSMGLQARDAPLFDRAREIARTIVEGSRQGDAFNLVRLSNLPPQVIVATPAFQTATVVDEIDQMQLPHGRGDLLTCLQKAADLLQSAPEVARKEIYLISDFQRATWTPESTDDGARLKELLRRFDETGRLVLIDLGQPEAANLAVTGLTALDPFVTTTRAARFRTTIRNFGLERTTGRLMELLIDDKLIEQRALDVAAGAEITENFAHTFASGGEHRVQVRLQKDSLPLDDQRWLAVPVKERIRVLCVNGRVGNHTAGKGTDFLELALSPAPAPGRPVGFQAPGGQIESVVINEGELQERDLSQYDCIFFCDVRLFTDREARVIETYLRGGGGVVWCLGDNVLSENYNQTLFRGGEGILPARLGDRRGDPERREQTFAFSAGEFSHPLVNAFQGNPDAGLETTQSFAYMETQVPENTNARVALRFDNDAPAIVERTVGQGRSILITTSVDDRWSLWPLWPSFLPLIHEIVEFAVAGRAGDRQRIVGESLTAVFPATAIDVAVAVTRPDGAEQSARVTPGDGLSQFDFDGTVQSG